MSMKIALAGIGKIARDEHIPSINASRDWELAATVSRNHTVEGVEAFQNIAEMLRARPDIETVSLCMPPAQRFETALAAIAAERNVMLEKPPGATLSECLQLRKLAVEAGVTAYATWHSRGASGVAPAKSWLKDRRLRRLTITWREDVRRWHPGQEWIWQAGGMGVFDPGINALSIMTEILPDPVQLIAATLEFPENRDTPIAAGLRFRHPHGAEISAAFDWRGDGDQVWMIEAETDDGRLVLSHGGEQLTIDGEAPGLSEDTGQVKGEYLRLYAWMATLVRTGGIEMDLAPLTHVADAFMIGRRVTVGAFNE